MKPENAYFRIEPKIIPADMEVTVKIVPLYEHCRFAENEEYEVVHIPLEGVARAVDFHLNDTKKAEFLNGALFVTDIFEGEQQHTLRIFKLSYEGKKFIGDFCVYSLKEDLFLRKPLKGDIHMHSCHSDGVESPAFLAAHCRKIGFDFMAVTDHGLYFPSVEAQEAYKEAPLDLKIYRGEEVHSPLNPVHIINFGGEFSVNEIFQKDEQRFRNEVGEIQNSLVDYPLKENKFEYASCLWIYQKIREGGGLGLFCHPYWIWKEGYTPPADLTTYIFEKQPFDAFELIGGYHLNEVDSNKLQVARYNEERANGRKIPIVGVSDAHGCEGGKLFGWYYTIVFSPSSALQDIITNIKDLYSVAVEALPGETPRVYGPYRLVKYALFLLNEVFPAHDEMCFEEGGLMLKYICGDNRAKDKLHELKGQTQTLFTRYWAEDESKLNF